MFQIGSGLRGAREQRGLELAAIERDTRIRARWLRALEEESFDLLPERAYALGFIRTYANYLGLDGQRFVDELSSRLPLEEGHEVRLSPGPPAHRRRVPGLGIVAAVGVVAVAAVVIGLIGLGSSKTHAPPVHPPPARAGTSSPAVTPPLQGKAKPKPLVATLVLQAAHGRCWLDARLGSPNGRELHLGTLELGQSVRLSGRRIWIRLGAPRALTATLNGRPVPLPSATPENVVVTAAGVRPAS